jgi:hypothetical protein
VLSLSEALVECDFSGSSGESLNSIFFFMEALGLILDLADEL